MTQHRIYRMTWQSLYPNYVNKAERKGRSKDEVDEIIRWLTGYSQAQLDHLLTTDTNLEQFIAEAPKLNEARTEIRGVICGVRIEEIDDDLMRELRYLDKMIDELARGRAMQKILRELPAA